MQHDTFDENPWRFLTEKKRLPNPYVFSAKSFQTNVFDENPCCFLIISHYFSLSRRFMWKIFKIEKTHIKWDDSIEVDGPGSRGWERGSRVCGVGSVRILHCGGRREEGRGGGVRFPLRNLTTPQHEVGNKINEKPYELCIFLCCFLIKP